MKLLFSALTLSIMLFAATSCEQQKKVNCETEKELIYSMLNRQVDGLIIASTQKNQEEIYGILPLARTEQYNMKDNGDCIWAALRRK